MQISQKLYLKMLKQKGLLEFKLFAYVCSYMGCLNTIWPIVLCYTNCRNIQNSFVSFNHLLYFIISFHDKYMYF